ncbi:GNAT family N-acetyltransferase [Bacteroides sp. 519]|uniref:GNAT family N-acetyltransferase n=1 Tax=Bacteroides sp. 519 TaxID=2302937 RepID=UPI0013D127C4|nr:GNAT family N-acetyltransferase [Bacteroides sp. 519]NDV58849.1 N-acetyltransferase [Bacteroides sp. 519]
MKNKTYLESDHIYLRAAEPVDLEVMYEVENDSSMWEISCCTVPYSRYILKEYIKNSSYDIYADKQLRMMIVQKGSDMVIGIIDITDFVPLHGRGAIGIMIREGYRKHGYAKEALNLLLEYSFEYLHLKQLYAYIAVDNEDSIRLFNSCGFVQSGLLKDWLHTGNEYKDTILLQCISPN